MLPRKKEKRGIQPNSHPQGNRSWNDLDNLRIPAEDQHIVRSILALLASLPLARQAGWWQHWAIARS